REVRRDGEAPGTTERSQTMARKTAPRAQREAAREARAAKVEQMQDDLAAAVADLTESGAWQRWLDHLGSFHNYRFNNTMLILVQCPTASRVAGYQAWKAKGRQVGNREKGIPIFGKPFRRVTETDEATGEETPRRVSMPPTVVTQVDISPTAPTEAI